MSLLEFPDISTSSESNSLKYPAVRVLSLNDIISRVPRSPLKKKKKPYIFFSINLIKFPSESKKTRSKENAWQESNTNTHTYRENVLHSWLYGAFIGGQVQDHVLEYSLSLWVAQCNEHITFIHSAGYFQDSVFLPVILMLAALYLPGSLSKNTDSYTSFEIYWIRLSWEEDLGIFSFQIP